MAFQSPSLHLRASAQRAQLLGRILSLLRVQAVSASFCLNQFNLNLLRFNRFWWPYLSIQCQHFKMLIKPLFCLDCPKIRPNSNSPPLHRSPLPSLHLTQPNKHTHSYRFQRYGRNYRHKHLWEDISKTISVTQVFLALSRKSSKTVCPTCSSFLDTYISSPLFFCACAWLLSHLNLQRTFRAMVIHHLPAVPSLLYLFKAIGFDQEANFMIVIVKLSDYCFPILIKMSLNSLHLTSS